MSDHRPLAHLRLSERDLDEIERGTADPKLKAAVDSALLVDSLTDDERTAAGVFGMSLEAYAAWKGVRTDADADAARARLKAIDEWKAASA